MFKRFLLYGMPLYLLVAELGMKFLLAEEASIFLTGPTIAVGGLSLILPTLTPKPVPLPANAPANLVVMNASDQLLMQFATAFVFILFLTWAFSLYLTHFKPPSTWALVIGVATYIIGIVFTELKEVV
jgi:hypothetical protein